jgi:hypothetical protein
MILQLRRPALHQMTFTFHSLSLLASVIYVLLKTRSSLLKLRVDHLSHPCNASLHFSYPTFKRRLDNLTEYVPR